MPLNEGLQKITRLRELERQFTRVFTDHGVTPRRVFLHGGWIGVELATEAESEQLMALLSEVKAYRDVRYYEWSDNAHIVIAKVDPPTEG